MRLQSKFSLLVALLTVVLLASASGITAKSKAEDAPGQAKKEEHAIVGDVQSVAGHSVSVENKDKKVTETEVDDVTKIVGQDKKALKLSEIKEHDTVAVIATDSASATDSMKKAKKIFVREASDSAKISKRKAVMGIISAINGSTITLVHQIHHDRIFTVLTTSTTIIKMKGSESTSSASLHVGQRIAAIGDVNDAGSIIAKYIHVIPGKAIGVFGKNPLGSASGSATPTASASATPSASASASASPTATP